MRSRACGRDDYTVSIRSAVCRGQKPGIIIADPGREHIPAHRRAIPIPRFPDAHSNSWAESLFAFVDDAREHAEPITWKKGPRRDLRCHILRVPRQTRMGHLPEYRTRRLRDPREQPTLGRHVDSFAEDVSATTKWGRSLDGTAGQRARLVSESVIIGTTDKPRNKRRGGKKGRGSGRKGY